MDPITVEFTLFFPGGGPVAYIVIVVLGILCIVWLVKFAVSLATGAGGS